MTGPLVPNVVGTLIFAAVALLSVFYGMPENALVFCLAVFALLLGASVVGPARVAASLASQPGASFVAVGTLLLLAINYQFSLSKDSGFASTWSLALLPLTFLVVRELRDWGWRVHGAVSVLVLAFAGISVWNYLMHGARPALPLTDVNNYCTLLYVVLLPGCYGYLSRVWRGEPLAWYWHLAAHLGAGLLILVIFATESRAGAIIVATGMLIFLGVGISRGARQMPAWSLLGLTAVLYLAVSALHAGDGRFDSKELSEGTELRGVLNSAALEIYSDHPVMGAGINAFPILYRISRDPLDQETAGLSPHNDYLQLLAEGGPLLLLMLLVLAGGVVLRVFKLAVLQLRLIPDRSFGVLLALGAALAHAAINFVLLTPVLACVLGISAALVPWQSGVAPAKRVRPLRVGSIAVLCWGWASFGYLALDTLSLGVYEGQPGIPLADQIRRDPERVLAYSRFVQAVNSDRGVPVLAEAAYHQAQLADAPESAYLQDLTLHTYRRARRVDPWNPYALLQMHEFVVAHPAVHDKLADGERPFDLLLRATALDPLLLPAYDRLIAALEAQGRGALAYELVKERLAPWLEWLGLQDPEAASRVLGYLQGWALQREEREFQGVLERKGQLLASQQHFPREMWFR